MATETHGRVGHCIICKLPNPKRKRDFVCVECVNPNKTTFVCKKCGRREEFSADTIARLSEVLGENITLEQIEGAIVATTCCAECVKRFGGRRVNTIFYIFVGGNN